MCARREFVNFAPATMTAMKEQNTIILGTPAKAMEFAMKTYMVDSQVELLLV
jgi:hypothetical protein